MKFFFSHVLMFLLNILTERVTAVSNALVQSGAATITAVMFPGLCWDYWHFSLKVHSALTVTPTHLYKQELVKPLYHAMWYVDYKAIKRGR